MRFVIMIAVLLLARHTDIPSESASYVTGILTFGLIYAFVLDIAHFFKK